MPLIWDPGQYSRFAGHRGRPFVELVGRIDAELPRRVVDLGCGPGNMSALLAERWPQAAVEGFDSSAEMIGKALETVPGIGFQVLDVVDWHPAPDVDVVVSNATLQWVPQHRELLVRWADELPAGAWLAWQVPGNFTAPSHLLMRDLAESPRWVARLGGVLRHEHAVEDPVGYANLLQRSGFEADCWETTYVQVLSGADPVLEWVRGTGLRPILQALEPDEAAAFETEYAAALRSVYPAGPNGTLFPFRRIFAVGHKP